MSTTVTYKGSTLTTVDNETKTLKTAGKYMEGDVIITDVTQSGGVSITEETDVGGGTIVHINSGIVVSGTKTITTNGTHDVTNYAAAEVNVPTGGQINNQTKTGINPSTSSQTITYDSGYTGLESVQINAMPAMTLPTTTSGTGSGTTKATVSRSTSDQYINIPTGYNSAAANYKVSAVPNGTATAPSTISGTSATVSTGTNTLTLSKTVSVTPNVSTAGYISSGTAGNSNVSLTASVTTKAATTYHPSTTDQTVAASTYLTGDQTFKAVTLSNLTADNIKSGVVVKVGDSTDDDCVTSVTGTYSGGGGGSFNVATTTWTNSSNTTTSHQFTSLSGTPKFAVLRCTTQLTRSSNQTYYYIADIVWNGTSAYGNYHLRSNGSYNNVASNATTKYTVTTSTNSITFTSGGSRSAAPGSFYNGTYELTYVY